MRKIRICEFLINLKHGSGPFRRIKDIDNRKFEVDICLIMNNNDPLKHFASQTSFKIFTFNGRNYFDIKMYYNLYKWWKYNKYDIIHTHHNFPGILMSIFIKFFYRNSIIVHSFGTSFKNIKIIFRILHRMFTIKYVQKIVCCSYSVRKSLGTLKEKYKNKIIVIENGVNVEEICKYKKFKRKMRSKYNIQNNAFVITSIGRLIALKNQRTMIEALHLIKEITDKEFKLFLVGDGKEKGKLQKLVGKYGLNDKVFFTGQISQIEVYKYLSMTDIYVQLSFWEGLSAAVLEAMSMGIPVILSSIPSHIEIIQNGMSGILVDPKNPHDVANAIIYLMNNPKERKKMGENAKRIVKSLYSLESTVKKYEQLYYELVKTFYE